ncbi:MAG: ABC transporter permease, partial [Syntrophothermus sp.]
GVGEAYRAMSGLDTMMTEGEFKLQEGDKDFAVLGYGVAYYLGTNLEDYAEPISVYVPRRSGNFSQGMENAFNNEIIFPSGYFSIQQDYDVKYVLVPIRFARKILEYDKELTSLEIDVAPGVETATVIRELKTLTGDRFTIRDRFQQQELFYKIMRSEKWAIFLILTFILLIATFNVIGSLSILIIDKKQDIAMLQSMGANVGLVKKIFMMEGLLISFLGAMLGLVLGALICWLQMRFGFVKLGNAGSTFVIDAYPVKMLWTDFLFVLITVMGIGLLATWYPVYNIRKIETKILYQRF